MTHRLTQSCTDWYCKYNATFYCAMLLFPFTPKKLPSHPNPSNSPPKTWGSWLHHSIHTLPKTNSLHRKKKNNWGWFFDQFPLGGKKKQAFLQRVFPSIPRRFIFFSSAAFRKISKAWSETTGTGGWGRLGKRNAFRFGCFLEKKHPRWRYAIIFENFSIYWKSWIQNIHHKITQAAYIQIK